MKSEELVLLWSSLATYQESLVDQKEFRQVTRVIDQLKRRYIDASVAERQLELKGVNDAVQAKKSEPKAK